MKAFLGLMLTLVPSCLGAQEAVTLDQSFSMNFGAARASADGASSHSSDLQADYHFNVGMPVFVYRLGALNLGGGVGWVRENIDGQSDSALTLNTLSVSGALFPYRPFHLSFDFQRTASPLLFGVGTNHADTWGVGLSYHGPLVQSLRMAFRHAATSGFAQARFSSLDVADDQRRGNTDLHFQWGVVQADNEGVSWRFTNLAANATTNLTRDWYFQNSIHSQHSEGRSQTQFASNLVGRTAGWLLMTSMDAAYNTFADQTGRTLGLAQSLARTWGRLSLFTSMGLTTASVSGAQQAPPDETHLTLGTIYKLNHGWSVSTDASGAWSKRPDAQGVSVAALGQTRTLHAGLSWGGTVPDQLRHILFFWTNLRFERRLSEDYPPGYLPPEVTHTLMRRRQEQDGSLSFASDLYRSDNGVGHQNWYRVRGGLNLGTGLMVETVGELRRDRGFSDATLFSEERSLTLFGSQRLGKGSITFSYGHFNSTQDSPGRAVDPAAEPTRPVLAASTSYAVGGSTFFGPLPVGSMLSRSIDPRGLVTNSLSTYTASSYGKLQFRVTFQHGWRSDRTSGDQITLNVSRAFDTIALGGQGD